MIAEPTPVRLSGDLCAAMPIGTELVGCEGYWKGASYVKTTPNTWCMFHKRPTPEQVWEAVEGRKSNLSPHPSGSAYVYEPPAKPGAPIDPSKVKAGDTVTLMHGWAGVEDKVSKVNDFSANGGEVGLTLAHHPDGVFWLNAWTLIDHQPAPQPEWKPGTPGTATVDGEADVRVFRVPSDILPPHVVGTSAVAWVSERSVTGTHFHRERDVTDFVPDDAEALRAQLADAERALAEILPVVNELDDGSVHDGSHAQILSDGIGRLRREVRKYKEAARKYQAEHDMECAEVERLRAARTLPTRLTVTKAVDREEFANALAQHYGDHASLAAVSEPSTRQNYLDDADALLAMLGGAE